MSQFTIIEESRADQADGSPTGCSFCGSVDGPFVLVTGQVVSAASPFKEGRPVQFCAPRRDPADPNAVLRQGCVGTIAVIVGYVGPEVLAGAQQAIAHHVELQAQLEEQINELRASQVNVVPVEQLMELVEAAKPTPKK